MTFTDGLVLFLIITQLIIVATSIYFKQYLIKKADLKATTENFHELKNQLKETTSIVEDVKNTLSEQAWVNQQVWLKKQEIYENIFESLFHIKKFVAHQIREYQEQTIYPETLKSTEELRRNFENSFEQLFEVLHIKSMYLHSDVGVTLTALRTGMATRTSAEWDEHFLGIEAYVVTAIKKIKVISKNELKM